MEEDWLIQSNTLYQWCITLPVDLCPLVTSFIYIWCGITGLIFTLGQNQTDFPRSQVRTELRQIIPLNMVLVPYEYLGSWAPSVKKEDRVRKEDKAPHHKGFQMDAELMSTFACLVWKRHLSVKGLVHFHIQMPSLCMQWWQLESKPAWKACFSFCSPRAHLVKHIWV